MISMPYTTIQNEPNVIYYINGLFNRYYGSGFQQLRPTRKAILTDVYFNSVKLTKIETSVDELVWCVTGHSPY